MLAHCLTPWDAGAFAVLLLDGDVHEEWRCTTGLFLRENQKTFTYAFLYGAGEEKLGQIVINDWRDALRLGETTNKPPRKEFANELGKQARRKLLQNVPALDYLLRKCHEKAAQGWFTSLDCRVLACPTEHGALNDVLQSYGAVVMKHAKLGLAGELQTLLGWQHGHDYAWLLDIHDEWQVETPAERAEEFGKLAVTHITAAGVRLGVRCPLDGEFKIGNNWMETH